MKPLSRSAYSLCAILVGLFSIQPTAHSRAADPDFAKPYNLTVVLDVAKNRVLTDVFRQQVARELQDGLQAAMGDLARVVVVYEHPKLAEVRAKGLARALDGWKERSDVKTHFVLVDLVANQYEIQSRQHDGPTGTAGPVVRTDRTTDRAFVARAASLLIERDFGFTAFFPSWPKSKEQPQIVQLELKGVGLGVPLSRFVQKDDVFAVVQMPSGPGAARPAPFALVQIQDPPRDDAPEGACTGRLFWRYNPPPEGRDHAGYRCIKLGAIRAPLRLRFLQLKPDGSAGPLTAALSIQVRRRGFGGEEAALVQGVTDSAGGFSTVRPGVAPFDRAAFVSVSSGGQLRVQLPVALADEQLLTVVVPVVSDLGDALALRFQGWTEQVAEAWLVHVSIFKEIQTLAEKPNASREAILKRARAGLSRTLEDHARLASEKDEMLIEFGKKPRPNSIRQDQTLVDLKEGEKLLEGFIERQQKILDDENAPERRTALAQIEDAKLAEEKAEYAEAIALYKKALAVVNVPEVKQHLDKLLEQWEPRGDAHRAAREFIYQTWPGLDTPGLEREMDAARKALAECVKASDNLAPRKMLLATKAHAGRLTQELASLNPVNEDDVKPAKQIQTVSADLGRLTQEIVAFLKKSATP